MLRSWRDRMVWKRGVTVFALVFLCAAGLCGATTAGFKFLSRAGSGHTGIAHALDAALPVTALLELAGMLAGALGLILSLLGLMVTSLLQGKGAGKE